MKVKDNYMDLLEHFKVEELKERLEFDMAAEAAGWKPKKDTKFSVKGGGSVSSSGTVKAKVDGKMVTSAPWGW
ncbi:MAG: hypothetical protein C0446_13040 [Chitinophaga sp.]|jgi:hypothetical protein|nr:hypothetical protein [Chitinophaga sp.]